MAGSDPVVGKLLSILNTYEYTEEELTSIIYVSCDERLNVLKLLMSQFSEDYKNDLDKSQDVEFGKYYDKLKNWFTKESKYNV